MSIIDKIKKSVEDATGMPFYYDTPETLNQRMSGASSKRPWCFPCAMLNILQSGAVTDQNGILRERLTIEVLFATKSTLDFDGVEVEACEINKMKELAFTWLLSLFRSRDLRLVSMNGTQRYYATEDAIYSAYGVNLTLDETQGFSACNLNT